MDSNLSIAYADAHLSMGVLVCRAELISVVLCPCDTLHFSVRNVRVETKKKLDLVLACIEFRFCILSRDKPVSSEMHRFDLCIISQC